MTSLAFVGDVEVEPAVRRSSVVRLGSLLLLAAALPMLFPSVMPADTGCRPFTIGVSAIGSCDYLA